MAKFNPKLTSTPVRKNDLSKRRKSVRLSEIRNGSIAYRLRSKTSPTSSLTESSKFISQIKDRSVRSCKRKRVNYKKLNGKSIAKIRELSESLRSYSRLNSKLTIKHERLADKVREKDLEIRYLKGTLEDYREFKDKICQAAGLD